MSTEPKQIDITYYPGVPIAAIEDLTEALSAIAPSVSHRQAELGPQNALRRAACVFVGPVSRGWAGPPAQRACKYTMRYDRAVTESGSFFDGGRPMSADGTWKLTMTTPMGTQTPILVLKEEGTALAGTMEGPQGTVPIEEGKVDGNSVSWAITAAQMAMKISFSATIDGAKIAGKAQLGTFGEATFEGVRE